MLIISLCIQFCSKGPVSNFNEEAYQNKLANEHKISVAAFIKIKQLEAHADTLEVKIKDSEGKREVINSVWAPAVEIAKQKCDSNVINHLDSLHKASVAQCDTTVKNLIAEVETQKQISSQKDTIIASDNRTKGLMADKILDQEETIKKGEKKWFWIKVGSVAVVVTAIIIKVRQQLIKEKD